MEYHQNEKKYKSSSSLSWCRAVQSPSENTINRNMIYICHKSIKISWRPFRIFFNIHAKYAFHFCFEEDFFHFEACDFTFIRGWHFFHRKWLPQNSKCIRRSEFVEWRLSFAYANRNTFSLIDCTSNEWREHVHLTAIAWHAESSNSLSKMWDFIFSTLIRHFDTNMLKISDDVKSFFRLHWFH